MELYNYKALITAVYDGDTVTADVDLGFYMIQKKVKIRLYGIDTPELRDKNPELKLAAQNSRDELKKQVLNQEVTLKSYGKGKYGRWLCEIFVGDTNINQWLIEKGFAKPYLI
jgi:micrococcal nuclease